MAQLTVSLPNVQVHLLSSPSEPTLISVLCLNDKEPVFQQAAQDARALFPISKYDDIRKEFDDSYDCIAHASPAVQEIARQMKHLDELDGQSWNFFYFVVGAIDGSRAVGVGSNKTKRERAAYTALAVTKLLKETGCGPASVSAEMNELASSIRRQLPRPGAKPAAPPRTQVAPKASQQRASPPADDRAVPADRGDHGELPPWADASQASRSRADNADPPPWAQAVPADHDGHDDLPPWALPRAAPPRPSEEAPSEKKKTNKIPQILEEVEAALEEDDEDEDGEDDEEVILSQPLVTEPPGFAEEEQPEPHIVKGLKQQTWRQEDAQTIRTTGTDDIPLGTDTDPSNYKNLWMALRATNDYTKLAYSHDLDSRVLDAENIGFTYSQRVLGKKGFDLAGVKLAVDYYRRKGIKLLVIGQRDSLNDLKDPDAGIDVIVADKIDDAMILKKGHEKMCPIVSRDEFRREQEDQRLDADVRHWHKEQGRKLQERYTFDERGNFCPSFNLERPILTQEWDRELQEKRGYAV
ncbi:unnamed protein product [Symbiodinium sp. CCMP2592]|nr:unnamed protein product [Symbiodinium sp. CCMP2592]